MLNDILDEACDSTDEHALRLFYITRNILEMYAGLVPLVHKSYLETIPHQVGEFSILLKKIQEKCFRKSIRIRYYI